MFCPICEYKRIKDINSNLNLGDFLERKWIENYFPTLGLSFEKIPEQKDKKTPDGYILQNQQKIALTEIKFLKYSKRELECADNTDEYLHIEIFNERLSNEIPQAKKQLEMIKNFEGPKIIYFLTESHEASPSAFKDSIVSPRAIKIDENGNQLYKGPISFLPKEDLKSENPRTKDWDRFSDGFLSAVFCFCCNPYHKHKLWLFENKNSRYALPSQLVDKNLEVHYVYK